MNKTLVVLTAVLFLAACVKPSPEMQVLYDAADALGGKARIQHIKTMTIEGEGEAPNLGQNITPDGELPVWKVTDFRRSADLATGRTRVKQTRTAQFLFAGATVQHLDQGIDGDIGYNIDESGMPGRTTEAVVRDRRIDMLHHPITLLRAAFDPAARVTNLRQFNNYAQVDLTTAKGDVLTLYIDRATKIPLRITLMSYNPNLGDVSIETWFADYETIGGLKVPKRLITKIDRYPHSIFEWRAVRWRAIQEFSPLPMRSKR
jgi:hypothetical protein